MHESTVESINFVADKFKPSQPFEYDEPNKGLPTPDTAPNLSKAMKAVDESFSNNGKSYVNEHRANLVDLKRELDKVLAQQRGDLKRLEDKIADNELAMRAIDAGLGVLELPAADETEGEES